MQLKNTFEGPQHRQKFTSKEELGGTYTGFLNGKKIANLDGFGYEKNGKTAYRFIIQNKQWNE